MEFIYELLFVFYHQTLHTPQISIENATSFNIVNPVAKVRPPTAANPHKSRKYLPRVFHTNFDMFKTAYFVAGTTFWTGPNPLSEAWFQNKTSFSGFLWTEGRFVKINMRFPKYPDSCGCGLC